jgi:hypothetical protein
MTAGLLPWFWGWERSSSLRCCTGAVGSFAGPPCRRSDPLGRETLLLGAGVSSRPLLSLGVLLGESRAVFEHLGCALVHVRGALGDVVSCASCRGS